MIKEFSYPVPDQLYIDSFEENKQFKGVYDGPNIILVEVNKSGVPLGVVLKHPEYIVDNGIYCVEVKAEEHTAVAAYLLETITPDYEYLYEDIVNHDGTIYQEKKNPRLMDYYSIKYNEGANDPWEFVVVERLKYSIDEINTQKNVSYLNEKFNNIELDEESKSLYNQFITDADSYMEEMKNIYPWRYVEIKNPLPPKIPLALIKTINELPIF